MNCSGLIRAAGVLGLGLGVLAGCGGSGSSTGTASQPVSNPAPNTAPTISGQAATSVTAGQAYSFTPTANDAD
ncbi:MAG: hypothetical protein ACRETP_10705, partial [Steroidobacteraceae bacterium]